jgi:hypothetical protein
MALQRHDKQVFVGDMATAVTEVEVLPQCEYQSVMAYPHQLKTYWGHKEVVWAHIYPSGDTGTHLVSQTFATKILDMYSKVYNESSHRQDGVDLCPVRHVRHI